MTAATLTRTARADAIDARNEAANSGRTPDTTCLACRSRGYIAAEAWTTDHGIVCAHPERHESAPEVGAGATKFYPSDRYGYVVTAVSASGRVVTLEELEVPTLRTGHTAEGLCNGFPVWDHTYTEEELTTMRTGRTVKANLSRRGYRIAGCTPVAFGSARYFRNYAE